MNLLQKLSTYLKQVRIEGKKINWRDGVAAARCIVKYGIESRRSGSSRYRR